MNATLQRNLILFYESEVIFTRFSQLLGDEYQIYWGKDLNSAMDVLGNDEPALLICDVHFQNQDIYPVVLALKQLHPELLIMIVTESSDTTLLDELAAQEEVFALLKRPIRKEELLSTIKKAFDVLLGLPQEEEYEDIFDLFDTSAPSVQETSTTEFADMSDVQPYAVNTAEALASFGEANAVNVHEQAPQQEIPEVDSIRAFGIESHKESELTSISESSTATHKENDSPVFSDMAQGFAEASQLEVQQENESSALSQESKTTLDGGQSVFSEFAQTTTPSLNDTSSDDIQDESPEFDLSSFALVEDNFPVETQEETADESSTEEENAEADAKKDYVDTTLLDNPDFVKKAYLFSDYNEIILFNRMREVIRIENRRDDLLTEEMAKYLQTVIEGETYEDLKEQLDEADRPKPKRRILTMNVVEEQAKKEEEKPREEKEIDLNKIPYYSSDGSINYHGLDDEDENNDDD